MYMSHGDLSKKITVPFHIFGTVTGKRKLRFDQRKNYERKKRRMTVSPLTCPNTPSRELVVSIPLSAYTSSSATNASTLFSRLRCTGCLQKGWSISDVPDIQQTPSSNPPLMLCKMQRPPPHFIPTLLFTIAFDDECTWTVIVHGSSVEVQMSNCELLSEFEASLRSMDAVLALLSALDRSKFCAGNYDPSFMELAHRNGGVFKDQRGIFI